MAKKTAGKTPVPGVAGVPDAEEDRLLSAIIRAPKDDTPRYAYADWLEKRDDPRGAFIRAQVKARSKRASPATKRRCRDQARALLDENWERWASPCLDREESSLERGFFVRLGFDASRPCRDPEAARLAASPLFALLPLHHKGEPGAAYSIMARLPRLGCFKTLDWSGMVSEEEDDESDKPPVGLLLMGSPHIAGLVELTLANCGLLDGALAALARNPAAASLKVLHLGGDGSVGVAGNLFGLVGARELARSPFLSKLESLDVSETPGVGDAGVLAIIDATDTLPSLRTLNIDGTDLSDAGVLHLSQRPGLARIERLRIGPWAFQDTPLGDPAGRALLESLYLDKIKRLELTLPMEPETARALKKRFGRRVSLPR